MNGSAIIDGAVVYGDMGEDEWFITQDGEMYPPGGYANFKPHGVLDGKNLYAKYTVVDGVLTRATEEYDPDTPDLNPFVWSSHKEMEK